MKIINSKIIVAIIFSASQLVTYSQSVEENLKNEYINYIACINNKNKDRFFSYLPPKFMSSIKTDKGREMIKAIYGFLVTKNENLEITVEDLNGNEFLNVSEYNNELFSFKECRNQIKWKLNRKLPRDIILKMKKNLESQANSKQVGFDSIKNEFRYIKTYKLCAISYDTGTNWKFIDDQPLFKKVLKRFVPKNIVNQLYSKD